MCSAAGGSEDRISRVPIPRVGKKYALARRGIVVLLPIQNALALYCLSKRASAGWLLWIDG